MSLSSASTFQPWKTGKCPNMTEKLLTETESIKHFISVHSNLQMTKIEHEPVKGKTEDEIRVSSAKSRASLRNQFKSRLEETRNVVEDRRANTPAISIPSQKSLDEDQLIIDEDDDDLPIPDDMKGKIIGITHVFSCINICRVPRMLFEHEADRPSVQHHPRDPASVNAIKQTCVIVILAYFASFMPNSH